MIEQDTIRLLRECDAGVRMGVASLDDVLKHAQGEDMKTILSDCKQAHEILSEDLEKQLHRFEDEGKTVIEGDPSLPVSQQFLALAERLWNGEV